MTATLGPEIDAACGAAWSRLGEPGTWWTAGERLTLAAEVRAARACELCAERKAAVSPYAVDAQHEASGGLSAAAVDAVHRIASDPGRLTRRWFDDVLAGGLREEEFVELVAIVATITATDTLARAAGSAPLPLLAAPDASEIPSQLRPPGARVEHAWIATVAPERADGELAQMYAGMALPAGILQALSLVRDEQVAVDLDQVTRLIDDGAAAIPAGALLVRFARAVVTGDSDVESARAALAPAVGPAGLAHACGVIAFFDAVNRVADATGTQLPDQWVAAAAGVAPTVDFDRFRAE